MKLEPTKATKHVGSRTLLGNGKFACRVCVDYDDGAVSQMWRRHLEGMCAFLTFDEAEEHAQETGHDDWVVMLSLPEGS